MDSLLQELAAIDAATATRTDYLKSLALLRALKAGTVSLDNVTMTATGWTVAAVAPEAPAVDPAPAIDVAPPVKPPVVDAGRTETGSA